MKFIDIRHCGGGQDHSSRGSVSDRGDPALLYTKNQLSLDPHVRPTSLPRDDGREVSQ